MLEIIDVNSEISSACLNKGVEIWKDGQCIFNIEDFECCSNDIDRLLKLFGIRVDKVSKERRG